MARTALAWLLAALVASCATPAPQAERGRTWRFDRTDRIGGLAAHVEGSPRVIRTPLGKAVAFDGADDALYLGEHPLAGARTFTIEAIFRPDGGAFEQRWLHLAEASGPGGCGYPEAAVTATRFLFEIRVVGDRWYLDAFTTGPGYNKTLIVPEKTFPVGRWYHVAQTYDGRTYRAYVDGALQAEADIAFQPQGLGCASVGTRINRRNYFHGAVHTLRFTPQALAPGQFMRIPPN